MPVSGVVELTNYIPESWAREIALEATSRRVIAQLVEKVDWSGPGDTLRYNFMPDVGVTEVAAAANIGHPLTPTTLGDGTPVVVNAKSAYAYVQNERNALNQSLRSFGPQIRKRMGISIANKWEADLAALVTSLGATVGTQNDIPDVAGMLDAITVIHNSGQDLISPGVDPLFGIYHTRAIDELFEMGLDSAQGSILSASVRGEANSPIKTGWIKTALGIQLQYTGHITTGTNANGTYARNIVMAEGCMLLATKEMPTMLEQPFELSMKLIAYTEYGIAVLWSILGVVHDAIVTPSGGTI